MSRLQRILAAVIALYLLLVLLDRFVLVELFVRRAGLSILIALAASLAIVGCGFALRSLLARAWRPDDCDIPRDFLLGYPIFGALCFLAGTLNVSIWSMAAMLVVCGAGGLYVVVRRFKSRLPVMPALTEPLALIAIAIVFLAALVAAQAPPTSLDELAYHLAVPWSWVLNHRAIDLPLISHSYFPLGIESADLPLLTILGQIGGGIASHILHLIAALATTAMLFRLARGNALAVAAIVTTPALALIAGWSLNDWPLIGICAVLVLALDQDDVPTWTVALGAGLLTKYTFIPFAMIAFGIAIWQKRKKSPEPGTHTQLRTTHVLIIAIAIGSIFLIRNLILTGNPIAPFLSATAPHVAGYRAPFLSDYVFEGHFIDESLGASLIAACALSGGALAWTLIAFAALMLLLAPSSRILLPFLVIPAALSKRPRRFTRVVLGFAIVVQLFLVCYFVDRSGAFSLLSGDASDAEYLTKQRSSYTAAQTVDAMLPANANVLVAGLNETYWFAHRVRGGGNFDGPRVSLYLDAPAPEALYARLKNDGITHVAIIAPSTAVTAVPQKLAERDTSLTPPAQRMLAQTLDRFASSVSSRGSATVFTLR
ncbi:MAG TPA: hypothetical protein VHX14_22465 [Thermoanaerobaculia bacterium]|jgi:hypothetical protein|nr:hypothetical protein [Thermoanaerobaculia bacterium]